MKRALYFAPVRRFYSEKRTVRPVVLVHGGTADQTDELLEDTEKGVQIAAYVGYDALIEKGSALDAVYEAIRIMEIHPKYTSPLDTGLVIDKNLQMDAAIMCGIKLKSASISKIKNILHPITLARKVMEQTGCRHLEGDDAVKYALQLGFTTLSNGDTLITPQSLRDLKSYENHLSIRCGAKSTVGAVAVDVFGNVAAATVSGGGIGGVTGGMGDFPLIGSSIYANNSCGAASFTVEGDNAISFNAAPRVLSLIQFHNFMPQEAVHQIVEHMRNKLSRNVGAICVDKQGRIGIHYTAGHMSWAFRRDTELHYGIQRDQHAVRFFNC